jgi:hypothetical protein
MRPGVGMVGAFGSAISISIYAITISPQKEGCAPMERPTDPAKLKAQIAYNSAS